MMHEVARIYSDAMNIIHYMHDKYAYEAGQMALHDTCLLYTSNNPSLPATAEDILLLITAFCFKLDSHAKNKPSSLSLIHI